MPSPLPPADVEAVLAPLDRARPFPGQAFTSADVFAFELATIFGRSWICVGREEEVALPGQWLRASVAHEAILVVRAPDLRLRAFFDVCRHRGASVVGRAPCGRALRLECPYHGWTYELDGRLASAPFVEPKPRDALRSVRLETHAGMIFVTLDDDAPPLAEFMGKPPPWLDGLGPLRLARRSEWTTRANWKLCVENFQESHHFPRVHRALEALTPTRDAHTWSGGGRWLGGTMEITDAETVSRTGQLEGRPCIGPRARVHDAMLFPSLLTSLQPDYLLLYRLEPRAAGETRIVFDVWLHPAAADDPAIYELWDEINAEDRAIIEDQQSNAASRAFAPLCYASVEEGMHAFDRMVAEAHRE